MDSSSQLRIRSEHRLRAENLAFDADVWYPRLAHHTFRSVFLPLTRRSARALMHAYQERFNIRHDVLSLQDVHELRALEFQITALLRVEFPDSPCFLRLCGRSPKDGDPFNSKAVLENYEAKMEMLVKGSQEEPSAQLRLAALSQVTSLMVRVTCAQDAMSLLLSSERVYADLLDMLKFGEPEQLVFREFSSRMRYDYEFRLFVHDNKITAISQYDHYAVYPHLQTEKPHIERMLHEFWERLHPDVGLSAYVMDLALLPADASRPQEVKMIELSPFLHCTGTALFSWRRDEALLQGKLPYEFRINTRSPPEQDLNDLLDSLLERWRHPSPPYTHLLDRVEAKEAAVVAEQAAATLNSTNLFSNRLLLVAAMLVWVFQRYGPLRTMVLTVIVFTLWMLYRRQSSKLGSPNPRTGDDDGLRRRVWEWDEDPPTVEGNDDQLLFVYGTLKRGHHWHNKFLHQASFVGTAETVDPQALVVGDCGVPYVLKEDHPDPRNTPIVGEVYRVSAEMLAGMDDYEGVSKGYYDRVSVAVQVSRSEDGSEQKTDADGDAALSDAVVHMYVKRAVDDELRRRERLREYTLEFHREHYRAMQHIMVKQDAYLQIESAGNSLN